MRNDGVFEIQQRGSTIRREILGGVTTFMAMSYILFVQPAVLKAAGMDMGGVFMATCISSAAGCLLMGLLANYPIALAPGMGENFFFAFALAPVMGAWGAGVGWQMSLALTAVAGVVFLTLSMVTMPLAFSISHGIAIGFVSYAFGKLVTGRARQCPVLVYVFAALFVVRYLVAR